MKDEIKKQIDFLEKFIENFSADIDHFMYSVLLDEIRRLKNKL